MFGIILLLILAGEPQVPLADTIMVDAVRTNLSPRPAKTLVEVMPQGVIDAIANADSVESVLLCPSWEHSGKPRCPTQTPSHLLQPYEIRARGGYLTAGQKEELLSILLDPKSYLVHQIWIERSGCLCFGDIAFLFTLVSSSPDWSEKTAVVFCACNSSVTVRNEHNRIFVDMSGARERLLDFSRALFPEDSLLAEIAKRGHDR